MRRLGELDIVLFALGFLVGIGLAVPEAAPCALVGGLASLCLRRRFRRHAATMPLGLCSAVLWTAFVPLTLKPAPAFSDAPQDLMLRGILIDGPRTMGDGFAYEMRLSAVDRRPVAATVRLFATEGNAMAGEVVASFARCRVPAPDELPGVQAAADRWAAHGVAATCSTREPLERSAPVTASGIVLAALAERRVHIEHQLVSVLGRRAGVPIAMLTASRGLIRPSELRAHQRAGTAHLLAISGLHFGALAGIVWWIASGVLRRVRPVAATIGARRASAGFVLVTMLGYVIAVGAPVSAVRAFVAAAALGLAVLLGRRPSGIAAVSGAAIGMLAASPGLVWDVGFQLSFVATFAIVLFLERRPEVLLKSAYAFEPEGRFRHAARAIGGYVLLSAVATAVTMPILTAMTGELSLVAFVANLFAVPLVSLFVFPGLIFGTLALDVVPWLGVPVVRCVTEVMLRLTIVLEDLASIRWAVVACGAPPKWWAAIVVTMVIAVIADRFRARALSVAVAVTIAASAMAFRPAPPAWRLHFIPVGQGDSTLVVAPDGRTVLVDAGGSAFGRDPGAAIVVPYLRRLGVSRLNAVVVTHMDTDHAGGVPAVLDALAVDSVVTEPVDLPIPGLRLSRWSDVGSKNNRSLVLVVQAGRVRVALTGDVESEAEGTWLASPEAFDVLKVAHHGSRTSTTEPFLRAARPIAAIVSAGRHNRFGHPHPTVSRRLRGHGVRILSTASNGLVLIEADDQEMRIRVRRP